MQKILITGVTGFIGNNIAKEFYEKYCQCDKCFDAKDNGDSVSFWSY